MKTRPYILEADETATMPVSKNRAKAWLRMEGVSAEDLEIYEVIESAVARFQIVTGRQLTPTRYEWVTDCFPDQIPEVFPIISVDSIGRFEGEHYVDLPTGGFSYVQTGTIGHRLHYPADLPQYAASPTAIRVRFTAGYEQIPADILQILRALIVEWFENRGDYVAEKKTLSDKLMAYHKMPWVG